MDKPLVDELDRLIDKATVEAYEASKAAQKAEADVGRLHLARNEVAGKKRRGRPPKALVATLAIAALFLIPATASALPPGYTASDEFVDAPLDGAMKDCAHGRAKLLRWHLQDYKGVVIRQSLKLAGCARNGGIYWSNRVDNRWLSDRGPWFSFGRILKTGGVCCHTGRYAHAFANYGWHGPGGVDNYWGLDLHIKMHVGGPGRGPNDIWFSKWSRFQ